MVRERIARVRYERTMTMREPKDEKAQGFESLLTEEEKEGLSEEEKMKRIAAKMEEKFKSEQRRVSTVSAVGCVKLKKLCFFFLKKGGFLSSSLSKFCVHVPRTFCIPYPKWWYLTWRQSGTVFCAILE